MASPVGSSAPCIRVSEDCPALRQGPHRVVAQYIMAEPLCPRASAEVKRGGAFWLRSAITRCNDCHGGREESEASFRAPTPGPGGRRRRFQEPAGGALASIA
eukprot:scaffold82417_cov38-Phaeocystis_antarctica.AAC.1